MMSSRAENGSYSMRKTNFWRSNHTCVICQDLCPSSQDKENHEKEAKHKRKLLIYDFFAKEVPKSQSFVGSSVLLKRYTACGEQAIGLECLHELHFSFNSVPWWACSICYESGVLMEQADMHLFSRAHIETYLDEFHSSKFSKARFVGDPLKVFNELKRLCDKVFEEQGRENLAPECLVVDSSITLSGAMARLGIKSTSLQPSYNLHMDPRKNETTRRTLQCLICHQLVACNDELLKRVWDKHELSPDHRRAVAVVTFLEQFQFERAVLAEVVAPRKPFSWRVEKDRSYGPVCGLKFLVAFNKGNFCRLCCTAVESVENHFSSEYHIMKFLTVLYPVEMFQALQYGRMSRMRKAVELISKATFRLENEKARKVHIDWFPQCLAVVLKPESHVFPTIMPAISPLGRDSNCLFCPVCLLCLNVAKDVKDGGETLWNAHCEELSHFEFAVRRACLFFDEKFFVPLSSKVPRAPRMLRGHWSEIKEGKEISYVQTQGDVGLEFIVDDLENEEVVCTLCARWFARGMDTIINNHIRSYAHFYHYLHSNNRSLLSMILMQKKARASRELMLEWLQQSSYDERDEMRSYSPEIANRMLHWGSISIRKVDATSYGSELRPAFECLMTMVDKVAVDNVESSVISVKEALDRAGVRILELKQKIEKVGRMLCRCTQCGLVFSSTVDTVVNSVWDNHLASQQHFARSQAFTTNKLDMLGFTDNISSYTVKPFKQQDPSNKVAWQWNAVKKAHEFVLTVIGLEDLVERRSSETVGVQSPDFFCRLCALVIPRQSSSLESHVRSLQHVLFFVHKYHPNIIMEMDSLPEGGMEMRKILAQLLKRHEPKSLHCIPIYDPVGEQKRKAVIAMQKAKDAEYQLQLAESRQAEQQRLRNEEKHRKQCEVETHQEERKLAERGRKEKEINGRIKRPEEEVSVLKLHKEAARKAKDERQTMEENEREIMESERLRRQDELRMLLVQEKQRLKALQVKEATQRHLWEEKDILERKLHELERCHEDTIMLHKLPAFEQDSRSSFHMEGHPTYPIKKPHELHQQSCLLGSDAPDMRIGPVPPPTSPFSISPSGMWKSQESSSQTVFKPFVAIASTYEEQARVKEARLAISSKVKQSELERQDTTFRPSLRDRKVDPYISNGNIIQTRDQLVDFIWRQGAERIPINELPLKFNQKAAEIEGALGIDSLYEVVCVDCSDLDTFYCSMCGVWTTPNDMFQHLETTGHKLAYLFRNYKMYHQTIVSESNFLARSAMLNQFAIKIWKMERPPGKVSNRLRSLLDRATIERIWPEYTALLDHSWKDEGRTVGRVEVPPPISKKVLNLIDEESIKLKEKEKYKDKKQFEESISVKERDKHYSIPKKRGKEKDEREKEESLRSRKHLPTFERPKQGNNRRQTSPDRKRHRSRSLERRRSHSHKRLRDSRTHYYNHNHPSSITPGERLWISSSIATVKMLWICSKHYLLMEFHRCPNNNITVDRDKFAYCNVLGTFLKCHFGSMAIIFWKLCI
ncbi:hypothetical protein Angca_001069 [Angiostrongylus cantonensis]|nr:hypothetical protein Angca_001069 [Angiostrongylus cantonensis]